MPFSAFVNLLMLTGPVFMLQVYDRVLSSRSEATLVALIGIVAFLFLAMGLLDHFRARVLARAGARFQARMDPRVLGAILTRAGGSPEARSAPATGLADLEAMQRFASGPGPFAFFDAPWTPIFLAALFLFHWMLGLLAVFAGVLLLVLALVNQLRTSRLQLEAGQASAQAFQLTEQMRASGETVRGLGMRAAARERLAAIRDRALGATIAASDRGGAFSVTTRTLRLFLQSMMLGLGAWLAIQGTITPGIMIAASILLGRALAPIDQAVFQWSVLQRALEGRRSLARLLTETPEEPARTPLPAPDLAALKAAGQPLLARHSGWLQRDARELGQGHARRRQRVADAFLKLGVPAVEIRLQLRGRAEIGTRGHDAEHAGHSRHSLEVCGMRQLPGVADGAEHLLGREIEDGQPVEDLAAGDAHAVVAAPAELPGSCGAFFGPHAHRFDQPPPEL